MVKLIIILAGILGFFSQNALSQNSKTSPLSIKKPYVFPEIEFGAGLTTVWINGNNSANERIYPKDTIQTFGGGFSGQQPGLAIRATFILDEDRRYRVTAGLDYIWLTGAQRFEDRYFSFYAKHTINIPTAVAGFEYAFWDLPLARAKAYVGFDIRYSMVQDGKFNRRVYYSETGRTDDTTLTTKRGVNRWGAGLRFGVEGEIAPPVSVNISGGYSGINLIGADNSRGQLFTPTRFSETKEDILGNIMFMMMLQYKL